MKNLRKRLKFVTIFILSCCLVSVFSISILANEHNCTDLYDNEIIQSNNQYNNSIPEINLTPIISSPIVNIEMPIRVSFENDGVLSYRIETEGLSATEVTSGSMEYDIVATDEYGVLDVYATYADDVVVQSSVYTYCNGNSVYISEYSKKNALEIYLESAIENNVYTLEEAENIWTGFDFQNEDIEGDIIDPDLEMDAAIFSDRGTICGTLEWKDDNGVTHPIQYAMVGIYKKYLGEDIRIETAYTDSTGYFSISVPSRDDVYIGVFAGDKNVKVKSGKLEWRYRYIYSDDLYDVSTNSVTTVDLEPIDMSTDEGQAIQISQAALVARNYAESMMGERPENVKIIYPADEYSCFYERNDKAIYITKLRKSNLTRISSYASWDMIMHEYGHHIQQILDNSQNPGGLTHRVDKNDAQEYRNKDVGVRLAWAESWPTVFGIMAQQFHKPILNNIETVGDISYTSYDGNNYNLEDTLISLGEACEMSIMAVLLDIYDNTYELGDNVALGHQAFWNLSTIEGTYTFSDFIDNLYELYPEYKDQMGPILSKYYMATSKPVALNVEDISLNNPLTLTWDAQGGSYTYPNNRFSILVYHNDVLVFRKDNITTETYTFSESEWQEVFLSYEYACEGEVIIDITIAAYQDDSESYTTGPYYSELLSIEIEHQFIYGEEDENYHFYICRDCGRIVKNQHRFQRTGVDCEFVYDTCIDCGYIRVVGHDYAPYNSCYEQCTICGHKNQIAEHDYTHHYEPNPDDTETHFAYCECGQKLLTPQEHSFIQSALTDVCEHCGININHVHYYTYHSNKDGETHMARCGCGNTKTEYCLAPAQSGTLPVCLKCNQKLKGGLIIPFSDDGEIALLPNNDEDYIEEIE